MRIFVYEYFSAGPHAALPASLLREGWAMLRAIVEDLTRIAGTEVRTLLGSSSPAPPPGVHAEYVRGWDEEEVFRQLARWADFTLVMAPEWGDVLRTRCRW